MRRLRLTARALAALVFASLMLPACSDMDEYFKEPSWIRGSIYEKLSETGQHTIFLRGAARLGYTPILNGKQIMTVMAPDDAAMNSYLQATYGTTDIDAIDIDEVSKLIGFHILYYPFDQEKLYNFQPGLSDGASDEERYQGAGLYYKFRTRSQDPITKDNDTAYVYHLERFLPVFSPLMFRTKQIDAKANYEYFYPETGWNPERGDGANGRGFQVAGANVTNYVNIAKNGYIYNIDRVLRPLETIYKELKDGGKYSKFLNFYDAFKLYKRNATLTNTYGQGRDLYIMSTSDNTIPPLGIEWTLGKRGRVYIDYDDLSYQEVENLSREAYSIFAPTDDALENFFNDYWSVGGYESLDSVSPTLVSTILRHSVYDKALVFPEEIEKGTVLDEQGAPIVFNTADVPQQDRIVCSNGVLYGCAILTPPAIFNSVTGPAYQYKKFSNFQNMLASSGQESTLVSQEVKYIMLYPDNDQLMDNAGIHMQDGMLVSSTSRDRDMGSNAKANYVYAHYVQPTDDDTVLPETGRKVYPTLSPNGKQYWYVKDGKITNCYRHNLLLRFAGNPTTEADVFVPFHKLGYRGDPDGWTNGHAYSYEKILFEGSLENVDAQLSNARFIRLMASAGRKDDPTTDFYGWINLLMKADAVNDNGELTLTADNCLMFVPVTQAVEQAIVDGRIPGVTAAEGTVVGSDDFFATVTVTDNQALTYYLAQYFVPLETATIQNYPYIGWGENTEDTGGLVTVQIMDGTQIGKSYTMNIYDDGTKLYIRTRDDQTGRESRTVNVTADYDFFPFVFDDGGAHFLEDVL